ncbi:hypothetical protein Tco_0150365 [Tanacetum coccineum]
MQSPFLLNLPESSSQPKEEQTKIDRGKKAMSSKDVEEESTKSDSDDETTHVPGSRVESSKKKDLKKFDFVTKYGEHVPLTEEQINAQIKIEEEAKAKAARCESEIRKEELIDLFGLEVDPLDRLNNLANKKRKHADDIHDFFKANKRLKSSVKYEDHPAGNVLNEPVLGLDDHARTFSSLLLAENDKRNLNPLKQMRVIEQDIKSKELTLQHIEELSYLSNKLNKTAKAEASVLVITMAALGLPNAVARRTVDELIEFSARAARNVLAKINAMITEMEAMPDQDEVYDSLMCLRDDRRAENNKLMVLNEVIAEVLEDIVVKESHLEIMDATINNV